MCNMTPLKALHVQRQMKKMKTPLSNNGILSILPFITTKITCCRNIQQVIFIWGLIFFYA